MSNGLVDLVPKVTIVCSWYNRAEYINRTVDSLLSQSFKSLKIILVDDGSPDENVRRTLTEIKPDDRLSIRFQDNKGFTNTISELIQEVESPYVCVMGAGDVAKPNKIEAQFEYLERNSEVVAVGTGHNLVSAMSGRLIRYVEPLPKTTISSLKKGVPFTQGTVMYRRDALLDAGSYDPFFKYCQDWDVYSRLVKVGEIHAINEPLYDKYIFEDGFSFSPKHKIAQVFFSRLASSQDRRLIELYRSTPELYTHHLDERSARYIVYAAKRASAFAVKREWVLARNWLFLLKSQIIGLLRGR